MKVQKTWFAYNPDFDGLKHPPLCQYLLNTLMHRNSFLIYQFYLFLVLIAPVLNGCSNEEPAPQPEYKVEREFLPYFNSFLARANNYGYSWDLSEYGLTIQFGTENQFDTTSYIGYCSGMNTDYGHDVFIDPEYWEDANELDKERLIYHELGHCLLRREHRNKVLPNGEWASMMRGRPLPENSFFTTNYSGKRRDYYIRELFNKSAEPIPNWAKLNYSYNDFNPLQTEQFYYDFNNGNAGLWSEIDKENFFLTNVDGKLHFQNLDTDTTWHHTSKSWPGYLVYNQDFLMEAGIQNLVKDKYSGISLNIDDSLSQWNFVSFRISSEAFFISSYDENYALQNSAHIKPRQSNVLSIRGSGEDLYFFINKKPVYHFKRPDWLSGHKVALVSSPAGSLRCDWIRYKNNLPLSPNGPPEKGKFKDINQAYPSLDPEKLYQ